MPTQFGTETHALMTFAKSIGCCFNAAALTGSVVYSVKLGGVGILDDCIHAHANVQLSEGDFNSGIDKALQVRLKCSWDLADDEVTLEPNSVNKILGFKTLYSRKQSVRFCVDSLRVKIILYPKHSGCYLQD